jgi:hypothetical protein
MSWIPWARKVLGQFVKKVPRGTAMPFIVTEDRLSAG